MITVGFIYTELLNQSTPLDIWPNTNWTDITDQYSGLFFRAEGKGSQPFGQIQQQNYSRISRTRAHISQSNERDDQYERMYRSYELPVKQGDWNFVALANSTGRQLLGLQLFQTDTDNVPINTAIKLWKRTG